MSMVQVLRVCTSWWTSWYIDLSVKTLRLSSVWKPSQIIRYANCVLLVWNDHDTAMFLLSFEFDTDYIDQA